MLCFCPFALRTAPKALCDLPFREHPAYPCHYRLNRFWTRLSEVYEGIDILVVLMAGSGDEIVASQIIRAGAYHCLQKENLIDEALSGIIENVREKARPKREKKAAAVLLLSMGISLF